MKVRIRRRKIKMEGGEEGKGWREKGTDEKKGVNGKDRNGG